MHTFGCVCTVDERNRPTDTLFLRNSREYDAARLIFNQNAIIETGMTMGISGNCESGCFVIYYLLVYTFGGRALSK